MSVRLRPLIPEPLDLPFQMADAIDGFVDLGVRQVRLGVETSEQVWGLLGHAPMLPVGDTA